MTALLAELLPWLAGAGAALATVLGLWAKGKADGRARERLRAAQAAQQARERGDAAARDAGRAGAAERLRDGWF